MFVCLELWQKHQYLLAKTYLYCACKIFHNKQFLRSGCSPNLKMPSEKQNSVRTDMVDIQGCVSYRDMFRFKIWLWRLSLITVCSSALVSSGHNFKTNKTGKTIRIDGNFSNRWIRSKEARTLQQCLSINFLKKFVQ